MSHSIVRVSRNPTIDWIFYLDPTPKPKPKKPSPPPPPPKVIIRKGPDIRFPAWHQYQNPALYSAGWIIGPDIQLGRISTRVGYPAKLIFGLSLVIISWSFLIRQISIKTVLIWYLQGVWLPTVCPTLYSNLLSKIGHYFLDTQYSVMHMKYKII